MYNQYQVVELTRDLNSVLKTGLRGVILEVWDKETFEVEFLDKEGFNYEYAEKYTYTLKANDIKECSLI